MSTLCVMVGVPGSGKTTMAEKLFKGCHEQVRDVRISRDEIRFSLVAEDEPYFSKEDEVYEEYISQINAALADSRNLFVFADATHLTKASRRKLLSRTKDNATRVICIFVSTTLSGCLQRNEKRKGTRSYVPRSKICKMYRQLEEPTKDEGFDAVYRF